MGASPDVPIDSSPAEIAASSGKVEILRLFTQHTSWTTRSMGTLCLESAIQTGQIDTINFLVTEASVDINTTLKSGQTALHLTMDSQDLKLTEAVIALGANINLVDRTGQTAFERAVSRDNPLARDIGYMLKGRKMLLTKKILGSLRRTMLYQIIISVPALSGGNLDQEIESIYNRWVARSMDGELLQIWIRSMSSDSLDWYVEEILGSSTESIYLEVLVLSAHIIKAPDIQTGEGDEESLPLAKSISSLIFPSSRYGPASTDKIARGLAQKVPIQQLNELEIHLSSPRGRMFAAGCEAKFALQDKALREFREGWLQDSVQRT